MGRVRPLCGNIGEIHDPHGFWSHGYTRWNECEGWSQCQAGATALMDVLDGYAREHRGMPADQAVRLECHPMVPHVLMRMSLPDFTEFRAGQYLAMPRIPVVITSGMEPGTWRLAHGGWLTASAGSM